MYALYKHQSKPIHILISAYEFLVYRSSSVVDPGFHLMLEGAWTLLTGWGGGGRKIIDVFNQPHTFHLKNRTNIGQFIFKDKLFTVNKSRQRRPDLYVHIFTILKLLISLKAISFVNSDRNLDFLNANNECYRVFIVFLH